MAGSLSEPILMLPGADRAIVSERKILEYLLNPGHPKGGPKAGFFASFGYAQTEWQVLAEALRRHSQVQPVVRHRKDEHGDVYEIVGPISTPDGRRPKIKVVWIVLAGETDPRLVTALPA